MMFGTDENTCRLTEEWGCLCSSTVKINSPSLILFLFVSVIARLHFSAYGGCELVGSVRIWSVHINALPTLHSYYTSCKYQTTSCAEAKGLYMNGKKVTVLSLLFFDSDFGFDSQTDDVQNIVTASLDRLIEVRTNFDCYWDWDRPKETLSPSHTHNQPSITGHSHHHDRRLPGLVDGQQRRRQKNLVCCSVEVRDTLTDF